MKNAPVPTAKEINEAHRLARSSAETAVQHAIRCGQMLSAKKAEIGRGDFDLWVAKNCDFGRSSAYAYMKVSAKSSRALDDWRSINQALGYESKPKPRPVSDSPKEAVSTAAEKPEITPPPAFDFDGYEPEDDDDFRRNIENVLMADDKLAAMTDQLKQCHREIQALKASRDHYQSQAGEAVRLVKARDREIERLKRQIAKQAA